MRRRDGWAVQGLPLVMLMHLSPIGAIHDGQATTATTGTLTSRGGLKYGTAPTTARLVARRDMESLPAWSLGLGIKSPG